MKKLLTIVIAMALILCLPMTATADTTIGPGDGGSPDPATGTTTVTYTEDPSYTVTIPASVTIGGSATVKAEGVKVPKGSQVVVKLTGASGANNTFTVTTNEGASLTYVVKNGEQDVTLNDAVLSVDPGSSDDGSGATGETPLSFELVDPIQYAGDYSGTVTFTVSVETTTTT